jgi:hypothetical protein
MLRWYVGRAGHVIGLRPQVQDSDTSPACPAQESSTAVHGQNAYITRCYKLGIVLLQLQLEGAEPTPHHLSSLKPRQFLTLLAPAFYLVA